MRLQDIENRLNHLRTKLREPLPLKSAQQVKSRIWSLEEYLRVLRKRYG